MTRSQATVEPLILGLDPKLRGTMTRRAGGRLLVIDAYRSVRCGSRIGDTTIDWRHEPPVGDFKELESIEGVRVYVQRRLAGLLEDAGATVAPAVMPFSRGLALRLERPELWIDYLDHPARWDDRAPLERPQTFDG
jgi:hypothetical protein